jgi:hypothetical protein
MNMADKLGARMSFTPAASADAAPPSRSDCAAKCMATSELEHAVSTATAGPCRWNVYDRRPAATLRAEPALSGRRMRFSR